MGKLSVRLILLLFCINLGFGQDTLCVFKTKGISLIELKAKERPIKKGDLIEKGNLVKVLPDSNITAIDDLGNVYNVNVAGTYNLTNILNFKATKQKSSFTSEYFKHIWNELKSSTVDKALIAGVFRGETLMIYPPDKAKMGSSRIAFEWDTDERIDTYYLFVRNPITDDILKIETNGSKLALFNDHSIFYDSDTFEWAISTEAYPNLNNIPFFSFTLIDKAKYQELSEEYQEFRSDLVSLGFSEKEIDTALCKTYKLCK